MKKGFKVVGILFIILLLFSTYLWFNNDIGILKNSVEKDARTSSKIDDDWQVAKETSDTMSAMLFYSKDKSDNLVQIYVNRPGLSFGYFFRCGTSIVDDEKYISEFSVEGYNDRAFVSLNSQQIIKAEINNGNNVETIQIDSNKPFAILLPKNVGDVTFFNEDGRAIDIRNHKF